MTKLIEGNDAVIKLEGSILLVVDLQDDRVVHSLAVPTSVPLRHVVVELRVHDNVATSHRSSIQ